MASDESTSWPIYQAHLRIARPTDSIKSLIPFYVDGLGFKVISSFEAHAGFDGTMLGHPSLPYHFEFTVQEGHEAPRAPSQDNLLVFYLPDENEWKDAVRRMQKAGYGPVKSWNPYWDVKGKTFEAPDGWRIVLQNSSWNM